MINTSMINTSMPSTWRKASYSVNNGQCVEVGQDVAVLVRDTTDASGPALAFTPAAWTAFTGSLRG